MTDLQQRSYKNSEIVRQRNDKEHKKLLSNIYGKRGIESFHRAKLNEMDKDRDQLRKELSMIRSTVATTYGNLPPKEGEDPESPRCYPRKKFPSKPKKETNRKATDGPLDGGTTPLIPRSKDNDTARSVEDGRSSRPLNKDNMEQARGKVKQRLAYAKDNGNNGKDNTAATSNSNSSNTSNGVKPHKGAKPLKASLPPLREDADMSTEDEKASFLPTIQNNRLNQDTSDTPRNERRKSETTRETPSKAVSRNSSRLSNKASTTSPTKEPSDRKNSRSVANKSRASDDKEEKATKSKMDALKYNPDGSLRTMHCLPDFMKSLREAMKARYVRFKTKQWFEEAFTIDQIFDTKSKVKPIVLYKECAEHPDLISETRSEM